MSERKNHITQDFISLLERKASDPEIRAACRRLLTRDDARLNTVRWRAVFKPRPPQEPGRAAARGSRVMYV